MPHLSLSNKVVLTSPFATIVIPNRTWHGCLGRYKWTYLLLYVVMVINAKGLGSRKHGHTRIQVLTVSDF